MGQPAYPDNNPKSALGVLKPGFHAIPPVSLLEMAAAFGGGLMSIPPVALLHLGAAMEDGRRKYNLFNWRGNSVAGSVYLNAALRHAFAFRDGEDYASDSKVHHLGHTLACCAIVLDACATGNLIDDRGPKGKFGDKAQTFKGDFLIPGAYGHMGAAYGHMGAAYDRMIAFMLAWWDGQESVLVGLAPDPVHPLGLAMAYGGLILDGLEAGYIPDTRSKLGGKFPVVAARMADELKARAAAAEQKAAAA